MNYTYFDLAKMIDHSLLNPTLTEADLDADSTFPQSPFLRKQRLPDIERNRVRLTFNFVRIASNPALSSNETEHENQGKTRGH